MNAALFAGRLAWAITPRAELPAHGNRVVQVRFDLVVRAVTRGIRA